jgi:hypothetical protein
VIYCVVVIAAGIDVITTNAVRKSTWPQTDATVMQSQDIGQVAAELRGVENSFPDPSGTLQYVIDGMTFTWHGRGRDLGLTAMTPGEKIALYYNPENPQELSTLVLLGAGTGSVILVAAFAFLALYIWFFWLRRSRPSGSDGDASFQDRLPEWISGQPERSRSSSGEPLPAPHTKRPASNSFGHGRRATFGKR